MKIPSNGIVLCVFAALLSASGDVLGRFGHIKEQTLESSRRRPLYLQPISVIAIGLGGVLDPILTLAAFNFLSPMVAGPLAGLHVLFNIIFTSLILRDRLLPSHLLGSCLLGGGSILVASTGVRERLDRDVRRYLLEFTSFRFLLFSASALFAVLLLSHFLALPSSSDSTFAVVSPDPFDRQGSHERTPPSKITSQQSMRVEGLTGLVRRVVLAAAPGVLGAFVSVFCHILMRGMIVEYTSAIILDWRFGVLFVSTALLAAVQVNTLNSALQRDEPSLVLPIYNSALIVSTYLTGWTLLGPLYDSTAAERLALFCGTAAVVAGVNVGARGDNRRLNDELQNLEAALGFSSDSESEDEEEGGEKEGESHEDYLSRLAEQASGGATVFGRMTEVELQAPPH